MGEDPTTATSRNVIPATNKQLRLGIYEVDIHAGELRKGGLKIKLHGRPFAVLAMLLERPGEVITREELQQKLWAADTFVDFEHGLNKAIKTNCARPWAMMRTILATLRRCPGAAIALSAHCAIRRSLSVRVKEKEEEEASQKTSRRKAWAVTYLLLYKLFTPR